MCISFGLVEKRCECGEIHINGCVHQAVSYCAKLGEMTSALRCQLISGMLMKIYSLNLFLKSRIELNRVITADLAAFQSGHPGLFIQWISAVFRRILQPSNSSGGKSRLNITDLGPFLWRGFGGGYCDRHRF